jgi:hypothetical protein
MTRKDLFAIPIFEDKVDLSKISIECGEYNSTWDSEIKTSLGSNIEVADETWEHLNEVISRNINQINCSYENAGIRSIWRNIYTKTDYQDPHIHPHSQWSFIIYETVPRSKTMFFNPSMKDIQNQISGGGIPDFMLDYKPDLEVGSIIIFPSFLMHMVAHGSEGSTISGNIHLDYRP